MEDERAAVATAVTRPARRPSVLLQLDWAEFFFITFCVVIAWSSPMVVIAIVPVAIVSIVVERLFPYRQQRVLRGQWLTDVFHTFISRFALTPLAVAVTVLLFAGVKHVVGDRLGWFHGQPMALQMVEAFALGDLCVYLTHRVQHAVPWLWRFHKIHHSSENLDWLAAFRIHPVDSAIVTIGSFLPPYVLGMPMITAASMIVAFTMMDSWGHMNTAASMGRFWWIIRNPEFHRWHHAKARMGGSKRYATNYCFILPIWDIIFGSSYMPRDRRLDEYGIDTPLPADYLGQVLEPLGVKL